MQNPTTEEKAEFQMYPITVQQLCDLTAGVQSGHVNRTAKIDGTVIDSRDVQSGDVFFALQGTHQHGVQFASSALRDGANLIVVDEAQSANCSCPHISVPDAEIALAQLANWNRKASDALVIAITGSVGKTTTRQLLTAVLETTHSGIQSPRNFNNHLGVPLSLLELQPGDEFAVIEMGASAPNEIAALAAITEPEMAVVTRIAPAHLHGFQSVSAVQRCKQQLVQSIKPDGTVFLNIDDPQVAAMASATRAQVITFGTSEAADVRATEIEMLDDELRLVVNGHEYLVPICGRHNATNVLAAIAVGLEIGISEELIAAGLQNFKSKPGRSFVTEIGEWTVIDDSYNSSPASVSAAIQMAEDFSDCRHRVLVMNDMLDLGDQSADLHYGIGAALAASKIDHVAVLGEYSCDVVEGFLAAGGHENRISQFADLSTLSAMLDCLLSCDDLVVIKGSRATKMERLIDVLTTLAAADRESLSRAA